MRATVSFFFSVSAIAARFSREAPRSFREAHSFRRRMLSACAALAPTPLVESGLCSCEQRGAAFALSCNAPPFLGQMQHFNYQGRGVFDLCAAQPNVALFLRPSGSVSWSSVANLTLAESVNEEVKVEISDVLLNAVAEQGVDTKLWSTFNLHLAAKSEPFAALEQLGWQAVVSTCDSCCIPLQCYSMEAEMPLVLPFRPTSVDGQSSPFSAKVRILFLFNSTLG